MYSYCYVYVFLLLCMLCSVYSVFIVPTGILRLPWLRIFRAFSSVVRQMPGYNSQRRGTVRTLPKLIVLFYILFACKCLLYYCHRVSTQLQQTNISYHKVSTLHVSIILCYLNFIIIFYILHFTFQYITLTKKCKRDLVILRHWQLYFKVLLCYSLKMASREPKLVAAMFLWLYFM